MKKSYFAIGAIAAAMCSCSSESIPSVGEGNVLPGTEDLSPISLSMTGSNATAEVGSRTRGTGTVGAGDDGNEWRNEELYILMTSSNVKCLKDYNAFKNNPNATVTNPDITTNGSTDETTWTGWGFTTLNGEGPWLRQQFQGAIWARPKWNATTSKWDLVYNSTPDIENNDWYLGAGVNRFYPINGVSDFFAYYVDDACKGSYNQKDANGDLVLDGSGNPTPVEFDYTTGEGGITLDDPAILVYNESETGSEYNYPAQRLNAHYPKITKDADKRQMSIKFRIDGTQDLLAGSAARSTITGYTDGFSAKSARHDIAPNITMSHLLTRLTFDIYRGDDEAKYIQITGIKIKSKDTGKLIVAYDVDQNNAATTDNKLTLDKLIKWQDNNGKYSDEDDYDETTPSIAQFTLMQAKVDDDDDQTTVGTIKDNAYDKTTVAITDKKNKLVPMSAFDVSSITHYVGQTTPTAATADNCHKQLSGAMFVAPGEATYTMVLEYKVLVDDRDDSDGDPATPDFDDPSDPAGTGEDLIEKMKVTFDLDAPTNNTDHNLFARGKSYNVKITVYGLQPIEATATLDAWVDGEDIWVGGDGTDNKPEGLVTNP